MAKKKRLNRVLLVSLGIPSVFFPGLILASILGWDWQYNLEKLAQSGGYKQSSEVFPDKALVTEVLDGDTIDIDNGQTVRLVGIEAPNRGDEGWEESKEYLEDLIEGETVILEYDAYQIDKFGRLLAYVYEDCKSNLGCENNKRMVNWLMVKKDLARVETYEGRRPLKYEKYLYSAE
ncbi:thermonuclease family protein [Candidatus Gottesmanbacteria bacterium]|nr:thermonuclease family protein [Candidatus Gottesmanbacteria bacterium]